MLFNIMCMCVCVCYSNWVRPAGSHQERRTRVRCYCWWALSFSIKSQAQAYIYLRCARLGFCHMHLAQASNKYYILILKGKNAPLFGFRSILLLGIECDDTNCSSTSFPGLNKWVQPIICSSSVGPLPPSCKRVAILVFFLRTNY
jgi:hypothetical protein